MRQIVLDCETTGLDTSAGNRIIEIGCIELIDRSVGRHFSHLVNPERASEAEALKIHKLNEQMLQDKPKFKEIWNDFAEFIKDSELIIHNASFDLSFLDYELGLIGFPDGILKETNCTVVDTLDLARSLYPGQTNSLDALCKRLMISNEIRDERHGALIDAKLLAKVYLEMTGGQTMISFSEVQDTNLDTIAISRKGLQLKVIYANESELEKHKMYINQLDSTADGSSLWTKLK